MSKHFTITQLSRSETARRLGIDNTPPGDVALRLEALARQLLDPVRELWGAPLLVTSGYRCERLNSIVGGAAHSAHLRGEAADVTTGSTADNRRLFEAIALARGREAVDFDQLIDERHYRWLHISWREGANRGQILHL